MWLNKRFLMLLLVLLAAGQPVWAAVTVTGSGTENDPYVVANWADLKAKMALGGYIRLGADVTDLEGTGDSYLEVPAGVSVTLDLNGHKIDRNMTESQVGGYVILLKGQSNSHASLTIRDSQGGGQITGGFDGTAGGGSAAGGINVQYGDLTLEGGSICGNRCTFGGGGGVRLAGGTFTMTGGSITGNVVNTLKNDSASAGGAIYGVLGDIYLRGGSITDNTTYGSSYACGGIAHNYATSAAAQLHLNGTFTLSGNKKLSNDTVVGSDYLHGNREYIILDGPISPTAPIAIELYNGYYKRLTTNWDTHMGTTEADGLFTLVDNNESNGMLIGVKDGNVQICTPEEAYWHIDANHDGSSEEKAYIITTTEGLDLLAKHVNGTDGYTANNFLNKYFRLGKDITYTHKAANEAGADTENNFTAIGDETHQFSGFFDGAGHTISGIRIRKGDQVYQGLFGQSRGIIRNVTVSDAVIIGYRNVGAVLGCSFGTVENCHASSNVSVIVTENKAGGIVGINNQGIVHSCTSAATVSGQYQVGGIVGFNMSGSTIKDCLAIGASITATESSAPQGGAIVGRNSYSSYSGGNYLAILSHNYYSGCTLTIGHGQPATSGIGCGNLPNGSYTPTDITSMTINDVTYTDGAVPAPAASGLTLVQGTKNGVTAWWGTYYHSALRFTLPEGATAYTMDSDHHLYRLGTDGRTIPAGVAVIIISDKPSITLTLDSSTSAVTDNAPNGNILRGGPATLTDGKVDSKTPYVLGLVGEPAVLGFYRFDGDAIPANKAYYTAQ